jgi:hypothetical protein
LRTRTRQSATRSAAVVFGLGKASLVRQGRAAAKVVAVEGRLRHAPLVEELAAAVVLHDLAGRFLLEVVDQRIAGADEVAATRLPELHREVVVAAHAGRELGTVAADAMPPAARHQGRRPGRAAPVDAGQLRRVAQQVGGSRSTASCGKTESLRRWHGRLPK